MLRWLYIVLTLRWRSKLELLGLSRLQLRVWPSDLDANLHMNNARFFSAADHGRLDQGLRSGLWREALRRGWKPMAGDSNARYSASLQPFARYVLETRMLGWDQKWFFSEHRFVSGGGVVAVVVVRYLFLSSRGKVPTAKVLELIGHATPSPELPEWVQQWSGAQTLLTTQLKKEHLAVEAS